MGLKSEFILGIWRVALPAPEVIGCHHNMVCIWLDGVAVLIFEGGAASPGLETLHFCH